MHNVPSEPHIDLEARARDEEGKRLIALSDTVDIDQLADTVRIERTPRAEPCRTRNAPSADSARLSRRCVSQFQRAAAFTPRL